MLLDSKEDIDKIDWFISKLDNSIYAYYRDFIIYTYYHDDMYIIEYKKSTYILKDELFNYLKQKKLTKYNGVRQYIKIYNRNKIINNLLND